MKGMLVEYGLCQKLLDVSYNMSHCQETYIGTNTFSDMLKKYETWKVYE